ncbi:pimeloyl-ACP methyl ester carboxylesterase [Microvirga lupini]|uniref:Pimeloyl-ACP methyl ester carboxylesterase n=1 Tax=Microvirga lupini TaxID=420324 RepID=A0A7W4VPA8_9HYPH|nr:alpha/beta fold hydrolase [Microvirga lupini]MBB3020387.1 pimeloyl-ACP methyl ester carboxylesterase [Microvirga lupini]
MSTFVLVHGAWHGAWCWERVVPLLESHGHRVIAPDLPGMGQDRTPFANVTLEGWARFVADLARQQEEPIILVGHSRAGIVVSQAAEYVPDRIQTLVYLAAFLVPDGCTLLDTMRRIPPRPESKDSLVFAPDGATSTIAPDAVKRVFYNTTPNEWVARAAALSGPEPMVSFTTPLQVTDERYGSVDRVYIECTQDRAIAPQLQSMMVADMPCREVVTMDTDHSPFYSAPDLLAAHLLAIAANRPLVNHAGSAGDDDLSHLGAR